MKKSLTMKITFSSIFTCIVLITSACGTQSSDSVVQTSVAETLSAVPTQPAEALSEVEVTRVVEVTKIVQLEITSTPRPTQEATETPEPTSTSTVTPTVEATSAFSSSAAEPTVPIEPTGPLGLSLNQLINRYAAMTDLQKVDYAATVPGKTVYWTAKVYNITTEGLIIMDNPYGAGRITLKGVPVETAILIDKDMLVDFRGMIESFGGTFGREIVVTNAEIVRYYLEPTATPTP